MVFGCDFAQVVTLAHLIILCGRLGFRGSRLHRRLCRVRHGDRITGNEQRVVFSFEILEIDETVRVDIVAEISDLKVEVRTIRTPCVAAKTDDIAGLHHLSGIHQPAGKVRVIGLQAVVVTDDHEVTVATGVGRTLGNTHDAVPRSRHRRPFGITQIDTTVHPAMTVPVVGGDTVVCRMMVTRQIDGVARCRPLMPVMDGHNVEVLIQIETRHPVEIGEQQPVAVVNIVQVGIIHRIDEISQRILLYHGFYMGGVVHHIELDMVFLRHKAEETEHEQYGQAYMFGYQYLFHNLALEITATTFVFARFALCYPMASVRIMTSLNDGSTLDCFSPMVFSG